MVRLSLLSLLAILAHLPAHGDPPLRQLVIARHLKLTVVTCLTPERVPPLPLPILKLMHSVDYFEFGIGAQGHSVRVFVFC